MTVINVSTSPMNAIQQINNLTIVHGAPLMAVTILTMVWIIVYMRSRNTGPREAVANASFFTSIICIIMSFLGLLNDIITGIVIFIAIGSMIPLLNRK